MAYSSDIRQAVGAVRQTLEAIGIGRQGERMRQHGKHEPDPHAPLVLVACSGGRDSLALASVAAKVCGTLGVRCGAVIVDHALIAGSAAVAEHAAQQCRSFGMAPVEVRRVVVNNSGAGIEADARAARYQELVATCRDLQGSAVLLAHTKDDQAETVMMGLLRTVGIDALAGMPMVRQIEGIPFARPLLELSRQQTTAICREQNIDWWDDPTNGTGSSADEGGLSTDLPLRSRIRNALLPYLGNFSEADVITHLCRSAVAAQRDKEYLDAQASKVMDESVVLVDDLACHSKRHNGHDNPSGMLNGDNAMVCCARLSATRLAGEHAAIRTRVIAQTLTHAGVSASSKQVDAIDALITDWHGQGAVALPSSYSAIRKGQVIHLCHYGVHANL